MCLLPFRKLQRRIAMPKELQNDDSWAGARRRRRQDRSKMQTGVLAE
jgi:hypothetical protein